MRHERTGPARLRRQSDVSTGKAAAVRKEPALIIRRQLIKSEAWQSEGGKPEEESM